MRVIPSNLTRQSRERPYRLLSRRGDGRGKVGPDAPACKIGPNRSERFRCGLHYVTPRTAMNVDIDIGWNQSGLRKAMCRRDAFVVLRAKALDMDDATVFYAYQRIVHHSVCTHETPRRNRRTDHRYPFV